MKFRYFSWLLYLAIPFFLCSFSDKKKLSKDKPAGTAPPYTTVYNAENYSSDQPYNLNVVYFLPKDIPLDPTYKKRLSALMLYGQNFYKQNMINNGYGAKTFGLFTETASPDSVMIVVVNGQQNESAYTYADHSQEQAEVDAFYAANPSLKTSEHFLILTAVPDPTTADVPFYGTGKSCFALDYPQFDIQYLGNQGPDGQTFSVWYGGMLHELGHGLNLGHSHQTNTENANPSQGMNLMWAGNGTLGLSPTFINRAGCAVLNNSQTFAAAPGITYYNGHTAGLRSVHAVYNNGNLVVSGTFLSDKTVTDVNIYQDPYPTPSQGYYRVAWSASPTGNSFSISMPVSELQTDTGKQNLQIELVLQNGETTLDVYPLAYNNGIPDIDIDFDYDAPCDPLPAPWQLTDIGTTATPGVACYAASNQNFRMESYADGLADPNDNFPFLYQTLTGDGQIVAKVKNVSSTYNYNAGIMIRNSLLPNSSFVFLNALDTRGVFDLYRTGDGGTTGYEPVTTFPLPMWLKMVRKGTSIKTYYSADSVTWTAFHTYTLSSLSNTVYIGLAASGNGCIANIDHVTIGPIPPFVCNGGSATGCPAYDTIPGKAINFYDFTYFNVPVTIPSTNTFTITGWIKPKGVLGAQSALLAWDNGYFYMGQDNDNQLGYVWNSGDASNVWNSGLFVPADKWSFVAMVIHPDSATLYLNNHVATNVAPQGMSAVVNGILGNSNPGAGYFLGQMDELTVWKRALSTNEIDSMRHLTKEKIADKNFASHDTSLVSYFQFNDTTSNVSFNQVDSSMFSFSDGANKVASTVPVGAGTSSRQFINSGGSYNFSTGITLNFPASGSYPNGNIWVSKISALPDQYLHAAVLPHAYWVIDNYGIDSAFSSTTSLQIDNALTVSATNAATPGTFKLYKRPANEDGYSWGNPVNSASMAIAGTPGNLIFSPANISSEGQLFVNGGMQAPQHDTIAGKMLDLTPAGDPVISLSPVPINSNTFTITMWVKPHGLQSVFSQIISSDVPNTRFGIGFSFPGYTDNLNLVFTNTAINYGQQSTINLVADQWNHVALTYSPDSVSIFLNGGTPWTFPKASSNTPGGFPAVDFSQAPVTVNADIHNQGGNYKGQADEICFYNYTLTQQEIREKMHLTKDPANENGLVGYYQFNQYDSASQTLYDAMGNGVSASVASINIAPSTVPAASGVSFRIADVSVAGTYTFSGTGATLTFPGPAMPNGEMVVNRLYSQPDSLPAGYAHIATQYWLIHNWGSNAIFTPPTAMQFDGLNITAADAAAPGTLLMLKRSSNEFLDNWVPMCTGASATAGSSGSVLFDGSCGNNSFSQFLIAGTGTSPLPVKLISFTGRKQQGISELQWKVAAEINLARYEVQRSGDGVTFELIGTVTATNAGGYNFNDNRPLTRDNYYRLKLVDKDGKSSFSSIVAINFGDNFIRLSPNPVHDGQVLRIQNFSNTAASVNFYLVDGRLLQTYSIPPGKEMPATGLPKGTVIYKALDGQGKVLSGILLVQ